MTLASQRTAFRSGGGADESVVRPSETSSAGSSLGVLRWPARWAGYRGGVRVRLTAIYGALFLGCGAALLTITYLLVEGAGLTAIVELPRADPPATRAARA